MSMPIQRQSESFGYFDDGPRFARDRQSVDLPRGLAGLISTTGPRITGGMLNTRTAAADGCEYCGQPGHDWQVHPEAHRDVADWEREKHQQEFPFGDYTEGVYPSEDDHGGEAWPGRSARVAVNVDGMDDHAYHTELPSGPGGDWIGDEDGYRAPKRQWNPDSGYEMTDEDERRHELVGEDDTSEYNWGPTPEAGEDGYPIDEHGPGEHPDFSDGQALPFDTPIYNPSPHPYDPRVGSRHPFDRTAACQLCGGDVFHISGEGFVHHDDDDREGWEIDEDHPAEPDDEDDQNLGLSSLEAWHDRHGQLRVAQGGHDVPWEQTGDGWRHPVTNISVRPSQDVSGHWQMWSPATSKSRDKPAEAKIHQPNPDPQALMDWHDYQQGGPAPDWHKRPRRIWDNMFPPNKLGGALAAPPVPGASAYQPAHRVGLPWRDQVIPGTVIGLDGPHVAVRWDDGQYSSEEPHNIHLL